MNIREYNRIAWDKQVELGNRWTIPAAASEIAAARRGDWSIGLTPTKRVPRDWLPPVAGQRILCLASGGGKHGPILSAAGADVTVFDNSPKQLETDRIVGEREALKITTIEGDMADLSVFSSETFDAIVHPVSNTFVPDVKPVWREAFRVLKRGGVMIAGFTNPAVYLFDDDQARRTGKLEVKYRLPYSDAESLSDETKETYETNGFPFEFSHTLNDQIGGQLQAGLILTAMYEDFDDGDPLARYLATYIATRAIKP
jgi:ubiquinone/menaquinone biosynthesis C-methylase UbiE